MEAATFACWFKPKSPVLRKQVLSKYFWRLDKPGRPEGRTTFCPRSPRGLSETTCRGREAAGDAGIRDREIGMKGQDLPRIMGTRGRMSVRAAARFVWTASTGKCEILAQSAKDEGGHSGGTRSPGRGRLHRGTSGSGGALPTSLCIWPPYGSSPLLVAGVWNGEGSSQPFSPFQTRPHEKSSHGFFQEVLQEPCWAGGSFHGTHWDADLASMAGPCN